MQTKVEQISTEVVLKLITEGHVKLKSTHDKLCYPIIARIYTKMKIGIKFSGIKVDGDIIIDGHHRYLASLIAGVSLDIFPSSRTSATTVTDWESVVFDDEDWDTEAKVLMLNEIDAKFNGISLEKLKELLK
jgi:hypothetical protein